MIKYLSFALLFSTVSIWASETLLIAAYTNKKDADRMAGIVRSVLRKKGYAIKVEVVEHPDIYNVFAKNIENKSSKERIIALLQNYFGVVQNPKKKISTKSGGIVSMRTGYNSNLYSHTDIDTTNYGAFVLENNTSRVGDIFHREYASFYYGQHKIDHHLRWNGMISLYNKDYLSHDDTDMMQIKAKMDIAHISYWGEIGLAVTRARLWYGGSPLINSYRLDIPLLYNLGKKKKISIKVSAVKDRFVPKEHRDMNSDRLECNADFLFTTDWAYAQKIGLAYVKKRKLSGTLSDISYDAYSASWESYLHLNKKNDLMFRLGVEYRDYTQKTLGIAKREDTRWRADLKLTHHISKNSAIVFAYEGVVNDANLATYTFKSHTLEIGFRRTF